MRTSVAVWLIGVAALCGACSHSSPSPATHPTAAPTSAAPTTTVAPSALTVTGVSPGVEQAPFYPATPVTYVACGPVPGGNFVEFIVPAGTTPGYSQSALGSATAVIVVPGQAVLVDRTGRTLYQQQLAGITTGYSGALVLSMPNATDESGTRQTVETGAVNVSGTFTCATRSTKYPGL